MGEGARDIQSGATGSNEASYNRIRDEMFGGDEAAANRYMGDGFNLMFTGARIALTSICIREALLPTAMYADSLYNYLRNNTVFYKGPNYFAVKNDWFGTIRFAGVGTHVNANILPNQKEICLEKGQNAFGAVWGKFNVGDLTNGAGLVPFGAPPGGLVPYVENNTFLMLPAHSANLNMLPKAIDEILMLPGKVPSDLRDNNPLLVSEGGSNPETYYRAMSQEHYDTLVETGKLPATTETCISPTKSYSEQYDGALVEFKVKAGTTQALEEIGVRNGSSIVAETYPNMPKVLKGWNQNNAFFKGEGISGNKSIGDSQINIGLGKGKALDIFNDNIINFERK